MTQEINLTILGKVKAKQSVKIGKWGNYTPPDMVEYANLIRLTFRKEYPEHRATEFEGKALFVKIVVYFKIPKSFSKAKREQALSGKIRPTVKPDTDNIQKNICDALNGWAYEDDRQIVDSLVRKVYAEIDYVKITIKEA